MKKDGFHDVYTKFITGMHIVPGMWRPHAHWEQVAWVSPPWAEDGYVWLDFPEVIMRDGEFLYAGHGPVGHPLVHHDALPRVPWIEVENGIGFERVLPGGLAFGGTLVRHGESVVDMVLVLRNGTADPLCGLKMQTCAYLRELHDFDDKTLDNKYVHVPEKGWLRFSEAPRTNLDQARYRLGWRGGPLVADRPYMVTVSPEKERLIAMTWNDDTFSLIGNPNHPCMHADPAFPDIWPGQEYTISGKLIFHEGTIETFEQTWL